MYQQQAAYRHIKKIAEKSRASKDLIPASNMHVPIHQYQAEGSN